MKLKDELVRMTAAGREQMTSVALKRADEAYPKFRRMVEDAALAGKRTATVQVQPNEGRDVPALILLLTAVALAARFEAEGLVADVKRPGPYAQHPAVAVSW